MKKYKRCIPVIAMLAAVVIAGCGSPAVTGMKVHMQNHEYDDVIYLADSVIAAGQTDNTEIWIWRGMALSELHDWEGAAYSFTRAWEIDSTVGDELKNYWWVYYNAAVNRIGEEQTSDAVSLLKEGKQVVPTRPEFDQLLGDVALNNGETEQAIEYFNASVDIAFELLGILEDRIDRAGTDEEKLYVEGQIEDAEASITLSLYNAGSLYKSMFFDTESEEEAAVHLNAAEEAYLLALEIDPSNADILKELAEVYLLKDEFDKAMIIFDDAISGIEMSLAEGWITTEEAVDMRGHILLTRGLALVEQEDYEQAVADLDTASDLLGPIYDVLATIAHADFMMEKYDEAQIMLDDVLRITSLTSEEIANTYYMKFACYSRTEDDSDAATALETALEYDPDNADYWEYLASTYSRLGRRNDAVNAMEKAESLR